MKNKWHKDNEAFLLFGSELNTIIATLQHLNDKNFDKSDVDEFIQKLRNISSYNQMLDEMIWETTGKFKKDSSENNSQVEDSMSLDEMLYRNDLRLSDD